MTIKLGSNQLSFAVQARLNESSATVSSISQRLSSGQRINKASDDAAGLAISSALNLKSRVFSQGLRNLNDGLSAVNIAESAIETLSEVLVQIEELAVQSMSGTYSDTQRQSMQQQVTALQAEWNRVVEGTTFNGQQILTGSGTRMVLQGGSGNEGTLAVQVGKDALAGGVGDAAGGTTRVSTTSSGIAGNGRSYLAIASMSADGRYVAFDSDANDLVAGDTNGATDIFIKDNLTGTITRVSTDTSGGQSNNGSRYAKISADGRYVAFHSDATNLVANDTNNAADIFVKDTLTGITTRVSTSSSGGQATNGGNSNVRAISADGRYVAFDSYASNLVVGDTNNEWDAFIKDTVTGITTRVSTSSSGAQANGYSSVVGISADGRYVAFNSDATNFAANDTNGRRDAFIKDTITGITTRVSTSSSGTQANVGGSIGSYATAISADGRYVAFTSDATNLVAGDTNGLKDAFIKDVLTGATIRVNTTSSGAQANADLFSIGTTSLDISADGRYVTFMSGADNLVGGDTNGCWDVFVKDTLTGGTSRISTSSSGVQGNYDSTIGSISADGRYVAFSSFASNLVGSDSNGDYDVFLRDLTKTGIQTLSGMVVSNKVSAGITLNLLQTYKTELSDYRGKLGASTSRITSFLSTLDSSRLNYTQASSRITDTDIAEDSAALVAATTRQQVSAALLGQANLAPQIALALLRNV